MNTLEKLYDIAYAENIDIDYFKWNNSKAKIFEIDNTYSIAIDKTQIHSSVEEKEIIAEELGHYYCNALYYLNSSKQLIDKCEIRAKKWAYSVLVPYNRLQEKIKEGLDIYELAEYFDVDYNYMQDCINLYIDKYGKIA